MQPGEYLFSNIRYVDVTVMNSFNRVTTELKGMKVTYKEDSKEHQNPDNANDKYMDIGVATCDSAVWLPAGTYQVVAYTTYSQSGIKRSELKRNRKRRIFYCDRQQIDKRCQRPYPIEGNGGVH